MRQRGGKGTRATLKSLANTYSIIGEYTKARAGGLPLRVGDSRKDQGRRRRGRGFRTATTEATGGEANRPTRQRAEGESRAAQQGREAGTAPEAASARGKNEAAGSSMCTGLITL